MREIDHDPPFVHLGNRLSAQLAEAVVQPLAVALAGVRIGELAVAVVGERHVAAAAIEELLDPRHVGAERIRVLDADQRHLLSRCGNARHIRGGQRKADLFGRNLAGQVLDRVELRHRLLVGAVVTCGRQRALADIDDEEGSVEAAFDHLRQVDLGVEPLGVVLLTREVVRIDVVVGIERDYAIVNRARLLQQGGVGAALGNGPRDQRGNDGENGKRAAVTHHGWHPMSSARDRKRARHPAGGRAGGFDLGPRGVDARRQRGDRDDGLRADPPAGPG